MVMFGSDLRWGDGSETEEQHAYLCGRNAVPTAPTGGWMLGCEGGHWVMGTPYASAGVSSVAGGPLPSLLPRTLARGLYPEELYAAITPRTVVVNGSTTTPAECQAMVRKEHPTAAAAVYSNFGGDWCHAAFGADGVVFDPEVQTCLFADPRHGE
eukprot:SAG22_NODE_1911_length_3328_cov_2.473521_3_plen_155_part_00